MTDLTLRLVKGEPLTNQEVDDNFSGLNTDKYQAGDSPTFADVTADSVQLTGGTGSQGSVTWNADEETLDIIQNGATLQVGQEVQIHCRNSTGLTIGDGVAVYATGTIGNSGRITVAPMIANGTIAAKLFLGITTEEILSGEDGKVTTFGKVRGLNTTAYSDGDVLYVSPTTAGALTATMPAAPNLSLPVAFVIHAHSNGTIFCRATARDENESLKAANNLSDLASTATARTNLGLGTMALEAAADYLPIAGGTITGSINETVYPLVGTDLDPDNGTIQTVVLSSTITLTESLTNGQSLTLMVDDGASFAIVWPAISWVTDAGSAPTLNTDSYTTIQLWKVGGVLYGARVGDA